jgi:serine/threonine protein kinase
MSGNFASVFCFDCGGKKVAVRCFLHNIPDQNQRYSEISKFVLSDNLECTVPFEYLENGIKIHGDWYPILKMEWVDGITLNQFVEDHLQNSMAMNLLAGYFKDMVIDLQKAGIAHGDLQHDNILISDDSLRLVDYDGLFVPALAGCYANELGHPNYQHPGRTKEDFSADLDNFSAWVIYLSLRIFSLHPDLLQQVQGGGDCLLLRQTDLQKPNQSIAFKLLEHHADERVRSYAQILLYFLNLPFTDVPPLNTPIKQLISAANHIAEQRQAIHFNRTQAKRVNESDCAASVDFASSSGLPDWMNDSLSPPAEKR